MNKYSCRKIIKEKLKVLPDYRRIDSAFKVLSKFKHLKNKNILSFASTELEINLWPLNNELILHNNLILPKVSNDKLKLFLVEKIDNLKKSSLGILEPNDNICTEFELEKIDIIFTPGLAFDKKNNRLGYGKGFYDKLLNSFHKTRIGICFKEQILNKVPINSHDEKIDQLFYF